MSFVMKIATNHDVKPEHPLVVYLTSKMPAVDRGSKARRSLASLYTLRVLAANHVKGDEKSHSEIQSGIKALPLGSKLQNHALDNRLNGEFSEFVARVSDMLPVQPGTKPKVINGKERKTWVLSSKLLADGDADPKAVASFVVDAIDQYTGRIVDNLKAEIAEIEAIKTVPELAAFCDTAFHKDSDARKFEIVSYAILAEHYRGQTIWHGTTKENVQELALKLFRTGRTNANDGGIDFVLQPGGRFFQVSETLSFEKYFLDFEKVNRYPLTLVLKTTWTKERALNHVRSKATMSKKYSASQVEDYMRLIDEVFTRPNLDKLVKDITEETLPRVKADLVLQFKLEYGLLD